MERDGIVDVLVRYARAIDTQDWDLFATCFTDDVVADYGDIGSWHGLDSLTAFMVDAHAGMAATQHLLSNFQIETEGDRAESVTYVHAVTVLANHRDDWIDTVGLYEDRLHNGFGGWRVSSRNFRATRTILSPSLAVGRRGPHGPEAGS